MSPIPKLGFLVPLLPIFLNIIAWKTFLLRLTIQQYYSNISGVKRENKIKDEFQIIFRCVSVLDVFLWWSVTYFYQTITYHNYISVNSNITENWNVRSAVYFSLNILRLPITLSLFLPHVRILPWYCIAKLYGMHGKYLWLRVNKLKTIYNRLLGIH